MRKGKAIPAAAVSCGVFYGGGGNAYVRMLGHDNTAAATALLFSLLTKHMSRTGTGKLLNGIGG